MDLEEYIAHLEAFDEGLAARVMPEVIGPAANKLYDSIKSRTASLKRGRSGFYDVRVQKGLMFSPKGNVKKPTVSQDNNNDAGLELDVHNDGVVTGLNSKAGNRSAYQATGQELEAYSDDVRNASEQLTINLLKGQ